MHVFTAETTVTLLGFAADPRRGSRGCPFVEETDKRSVQRPPTISYRHVRAYYYSLFAPV